MIATQVLPEDTVDNASQNELEILGHLIIETQRYEIRRGDNKIGRDPCCSIVIENCTVSKLHAVIECDGKDETFIYDCGSTNATKLKKKKLKPHCRYKLDDETDIVFGNIVATFKLVTEIDCSNSKTASDTQDLDELNDIFDLPTQVAFPGPSTSRDISEPRENFKFSNSVICNKKQSTPSDCKSDSGFSGLENSEIFDLSTQCQLPKVSQEKTIHDGDKIKSLLNDGQDDVLCTLMSVHSPRCGDETEIDIFDAPTQVNVLDASTNEDLKSTQANDRIRQFALEITSVKEGEDSVIIQKFDEVSKDIVEESLKEGETSGDEDIIYTQKFELPDNQGDESVLEISLNDQQEDSIVVSKFGEVAKDNRGSYENKENIELFEKTDDKNDEINATQLESSKYQTSSQTCETGLVEFSERIESMLSSCFKTEAKHAEDSGDETLSDLEINNEKSFTIEEVTQPEPQMEESRDSNDSYTFEVDPKRPETDSNAADIEIESVKTITSEVKFEKTQVLAPTPPSNSQENIPVHRRSPSPTCWSPLSLEMPSTQDMESTMDEFLGRKSQVGNEQTNSPLKRSRDSIGSVTPSPAKKPKTVKRNSKLWQVHDIAQIQPTRTRNSLPTPATNKQSCRRSTRRRKSNSDITPYLIRCRKKKESPKEKSVSRSRKSPQFKTPAKKKRIKTDKPTVAFTGFKSEKLEKIVQELGGAKTDDLSSASVVVADKVRRTVKFLCAIGLSLPITSPQWLTSSKKENKFVNPLNFILKDEEAEDRWEFDLKSSLERSKRIKLLEGYNVFATKSTKPPVKDLLAIVECCGGTPIVRQPTVWPRKTIIVSCEEDKGSWPPPKVRNIKLVHYEFILTGVLRQKIDFRSYNLR